MIKNSIIYLIAFPFILNLGLDAVYKDDLIKSTYGPTEHINTNFLESLSFTKSTDEAKLRLAILIDDKVDKNQDGLVQLDELVQWIKESQRKYTREDVIRNWLRFGKSPETVDNEALTWDEYKNKQYDHLARLLQQAENPGQVAGLKKSYENTIRKDLRKWRAADSNHDERLSLDEFESFLHPVEFEHMHKLLVEEKLEKIDKNDDKKISIDEYLADLSLEDSNTKSRKKNEWIKVETSKFNNQLDINHDTYLDSSELSMMMVESEFDDYSIAEAQHLMQSADLNRDHRLSKEEILSAYHEFVNSHATDFGEALKDKNIPRDEL